MDIQVNLVRDHKEVKVLEDMLVLDKHRLVSRLLATKDHNRDLQLVTQDQVVKVILELRNRQDLPSHRLDLRKALLLVILGRHRIQASKVRPLRQVSSSLVRRERLAILVLEEQVHHSRLGLAEASLDLAHPSHQRENTCHPLTDNLDAIIKNFVNKSHE